MKSSPTRHMDLFQPKTFSHIPASLRSFSALKFFSAGSVPVRMPFPKAGPLPSKVRVYFAIRRREKRLHNCACVACGFRPRADGLVSSLLVFELVAPVKSRRGRSGVQGYYFAMKQTVLPDP